MAIVDLDPALRNIGPEEKKRRALRQFAVPEVVRAILSLHRWQVIADPDLRFVSPRNSLHPQVEIRFFEDPKRCEVSPVAADYRELADSKKSLRAVPDPQIGLSVGRDGLRLDLESGHTENRGGSYFRRAITVSLRTGLRDEHEREVNPPVSRVMQSIAG